MDPKTKIPWWSSFAQDIGVQLTLIGIFCYGVARFATDAFLHRFHLTLGDIGLGYSELLAPIAFFAVVLFMLGMIMRPTWLIIRPAISVRIDKIMHGRSIRRVIPRAISSVVLNLALLAVWVGILYALGRLPEILPGFLDPVVDVAWYALALLIAASFLLNLNMDLIKAIGDGSEKPTESQQSGQEDGKQNGAERRKQQQRNWTVLIRAAGAVVTVSLVLWVAHLYGSHEAMRAANGELVTVHVLGITMPGLEAHPGTVRLNSPGDISGLGGNSEACLVRLGESGGFVIFHDKRRNTTIRLPSLNVSVVDLEEGRQC
jgi:hypothetical protein